MVASDYDLGDSMTKKRADSREGLMKFLRCWHWCIAFDPSFTAAKRNKRAGWTAVQKVDDALQKLVNAALSKERCDQRRDAAPSSSVLPWDF